MDWFERITGFPERSYEETQALLSVEDGHLVSARLPLRWGIGRFETPSLAELRERVGSTAHEQGHRTRFRAIASDAKKLHCDPANAHALFQVASQFNALEMIGPDITPEHGVSRYATDRTQGPACAIAAGAATIWRNYLVPLEGGFGQRAERQINTLKDLVAGLGEGASDLVRMKNGYAFCTEPGLKRISKQLGHLDEVERQKLLGLLRIALHWDVEVTIAEHLLTVSQAFCSALPCSYSDVDLHLWEGFARLVLEAAYEATMLAGVLNLRRTGCPIVYLTRLGGGVFGNDDAWIYDAIASSLHRYADAGLDVRLVSFGRVPDNYKALETMT